MTTNDITLEAVEKKFFDLLVALLNKEGFSGVEEVTPLKQEHANLHLFATDLDDNRFAIGVKIYRSPSIPTMSATFALRNLNSLISRTSSRHGMLVLTANLPKVYRDSIDFSNSHYKIWDLTILQEKYEKYPELLPDFEACIKELHPFIEKSSTLADSTTKTEMDQPRSTKDSHKGAREGIAQLLQPGSKLSLDILVKAFEATEGSDIADELEDILPGNDDKQATLFENVLVKALNFLFKEDLSAFKTQQKTEALHRFDLIARISSEGEFWSTLQNHFRAKYVIFEFKNHTDKITQREIYSTEKYLYLPAMRSVAIIISRVGPNNNAEAAARGSLREQGKVILNLTLNDVISMLKSKDIGANPNDTMTTILDNMLMQIER